MANPFAVDVPQINVLQQLMQGYGFTSGIRQSGARDAARQEAEAALMGNGDTRSAIAKLLAVGDMQGANAIASIEDRAANRDWRQTEAERAQRNSDRSFGLQQQQFGQSASRDARDAAFRQAQLDWQRTNSPQAEIKTVKDANGNETLVRVDRQGNAAPVQSGVTGAPSNPYVTGKFNEVQGKAATFADRMAASDRIIGGLEDVNQGAGGIMGAIGNAKLPFMSGPIQDTSVFNAAASPERQKAVQAQRDFVNAILRRESGAAISEGEFNNARRQYFPQPGDSQEVIEQKRQNRKLAIEGNMREAGPSYRPPEGWGGRAKASATAGVTEGMTATNQATGQKIIFRNGQWVPAQ